MSVWEKTTPPATSLTRTRPPCQTALARSGWGLFILVNVMTSSDSLLLLLRHLDKIERKLDCMLEELQTPTAIGYSARRGNRPSKD
jgi:hypothetical protein